jgi:CHAT domain
MHSNDDLLLSRAIRMGHKIKILFLAANPDDRMRLELGREFGKIQDALLRSKYRDIFQLLHPELAAQMGNFSAALLKHRPHIVHFCGHGSANQGIVFEGEDGYSQPASKQELTVLFESLHRDARLAFLNACHTQEQAEILSRFFDYTIGTNGLILDKVAGDLAGWFYRALADGATVKGAFELAQAATNNRVREISLLSKSEGVDDSRPFILQVLNNSDSGHPRRADAKQSGQPPARRQEAEQPRVSQPPPAPGVVFNTNIKGKVKGVTNTNITMGSDARVDINRMPRKHRRKK